MTYLNIDSSVHRVWMPRVLRQGCVAVCGVYLIVISPLTMINLKVPEG